MACPLPVINTKKALVEQDAVTVIVDDGAPHENVVRFARNRGYSVAEALDGTSWTLTITRDGVRTIDNGSATEVTDESTVILITSDRLGDGPDDLGFLLMRNFINTLLECDRLPEGIYFMNSGVRLTCEGSESLEALSKLQDLGIKIRSCGLCLDYFGLKELLRVGATTNMLTTVESLLSASKVIKL